MIDYAKIIRDIATIKQEVYEAVGESTQENEQLEQIEEGLRIALKACLAEGGKYVTLSEKEHKEAG